MNNIVDEYINRSMFKDIDIIEQQKLNLIKFVENHGENVFRRSKSEFSNHIIYTTIPKMIKHEVITVYENVLMLSRVKPNSFEHYELLYGKFAEHVWKEKLDTCNNSLSGFQKRFGKDVGLQKYNDFTNKKEGANTLKWYISRYGEDLGTQKFNEYSDRQRYTNSIEYYIEQYGPEVGEELYYNRYPKPDYDLNAYADYKKAVYSLSNKVYELNKHIINPDGHTRTRMGVEGGWQLDHIKPVNECFIDGVSVEDASVVENLRMLPWKDNLMRNFE